MSIPPTTAGPGRVRVQARATEAPTVGGRALHGYWLLLAPHFRDVLLPPERHLGDSAIGWEWRENEGPSPTQDDLAALRHRLQGASQSLRDALEREQPEQAAGEPDRHALLIEVAAALDRWVRLVVARGDAAFGAYVCRTTHGLRLHSWGLIEPGAPERDDDARRASVPAVPAPPKRRSRRAARVLLAVLVMGLGVGGTLVLRSRPPAPAPQTSSPPGTTNPARATLVPSRASTSSSAHPAEREAPRAGEGWPELMPGAVPPRGYGGVAAWSRRPGDEETFRSRDAAPALGGSAAAAGTLGGVAAAGAGGSPAGGGLGTAPAGGAPARPGGEPAVAASGPRAASAAEATASQGGTPALPSAGGASGATEAVAPGDPGGALPKPRQPREPEPEPADASPAAAPRQAPWDQTPDDQQADPREEETRETRPPEEAAADHGPAAAGSVINSVPAPPPVDAGLKTVERWIPPPAHEEEKEIADGGADENVPKAQHTVAPDPAYDLSRSRHYRLTWSARSHRPLVEVILPTHPIPSSDRQSVDRAALARAVRPSSVTPAPPPPPAPALPGVLEFVFPRRPAAERPEWDAPIGTAEMTRATLELARVQQAVQLRRGGQTLVVATRAGQNAWRISLAAGVSARLAGPPADPMGLGGRQWHLLDPTGAWRRWPPQGLALAADSASAAPVRAQLALMDETTGWGWVADLEWSEDQAYRALTPK